MSQDFAAEYCSFCGNHRHDCTILVHGLFANICDACIRRAAEAVLAGNGDACLMDIEAHDKTQQRKG